MLRNTIIPVSVPREELILFSVSALLGAGIILMLVMSPAVVVSSGPEEAISLEQFRSRAANNISLDTVTLPPDGCDRRPEVYNTHSPDEVFWDDDPRLYRVETNSEGWRGGEEYSRDPGPNVTRILVLGDSFTFGTGLNYTDTYPYQLERLLNNGTDGEYQVINAGVQGSGMPDYCSMLEHRGLQYQPDIVVVTFTYYDALSRRQVDWMYGAIRERVLDGGTATDAEFTELGGSIKTTLYRRMELNMTASLPVYMDRIRDMAQEGGARTVFYSFRPIGQDDTDGDAREEPPGFMQRVVRQQNLTWIRAPPVLEERSSETYQLSDGHYDAWADRQLARHLYGELIDRGWVDGSRGGQYQ